MSADACEARRGRISAWMRPGTASRDVVTTALYLVLLSPVMFVSALHQHVSAETAAALLSTVAVPLLFRSRWPLGAVVGTSAVTVAAMPFVGVPSIPRSEERRVGKECVP